MQGQALLCVVMIYLVSCGTFNITGIAVTGALSAVHRMMLDASRTAGFSGYARICDHVSSEDEQTCRQATRGSAAMALL